MEKNETELQKAQRQLKKKSDEFNDLMTKYLNSQEKMQQQNEHQAEKSRETTPTQKTAVLITDSNGIRIKPKLPRNEGVEWMHIKNVYRAVDIPRQLNNEDAKQTLNKADSITVMVGLNEIRDGKTATETLRSIEKNIQPLIDTNKPIIFCEIPPVANSISDKIEAEGLNRLLKRLPQKYPNITILEAWEELDAYEPTEIYEDDLFHLHKEKDGTTIMAQKILNLTKEAHQDTTPAKQIITNKIDIPNDTAKHYIGTNGKNLKKLTSDHQVNIAIPNEGDQIIITGTQEKVESASQEILKMKESLARNVQPQPQQNYRTRTCTFFQQGTCKKGERCTYKHTNETRSRSRSNVREDRSMSDERHQYEPVERSQTLRQRHPSNGNPHQTRSTERRNNARSRSSGRHHQERPEESSHHQQQSQSQYDRRRRSRSTDRQRSGSMGRTSQDNRAPRTQNMDERTRSSRRDNYYSYSQH